MSEFDSLEGHDPKAEAEATGGPKQNDKPEDKPADKPAAKSSTQKSDSKD